MIMFSGIMNAERLASILDAGLLPFIEEKFSDGLGYARITILSIAANILRTILKQTMSIGGQLHRNPQT